MMDKQRKFANIADIRILDITIVERPSNISVTIFEEFNCSTGSHGKTFNISLRKRFQGFIAHLNHPRIHILRHLQSGVRIHQD